MDIKACDKEYIMGTYARNDILLIKGKSATAIDNNGKEYIDFTSGIGVNSLGYCDDDWAKAVAEQANLLQHTSNLYYTEPSAKLAKALCESTGYKKALFCNSGAEANECAIKIARKYSFDKYGKDANRFKILTLKNSFHGRTVTTLSATGQDVFHNYFFPFTEGFEYGTANDADAVINELEKGGYCALMFEFIQGEGGVIPLDKDFVKKVFDYCKENDILTIADEVQTGIGRTGKILASMNYDVLPNLTTLAKGLGGGLPIGACIADENTCDVFSYSDHGTTFGANPVVCAGALTAFNKISDESFLAEVLNKGELLKSELLKLDGVEKVDGMGMMLGITLTKKTAKEALNECAQNGLLVLTAKEKVRLLPPLSIKEDELLKGIEILKKVLN